MRGGDTGTMTDDGPTRGGTRTEAETVTDGETMTGTETETMNIAGGGTTDPGIAGADRAPVGTDGPRRRATVDRPLRARRRKCLRRKRNASFG